MTTLTLLALLAGDPCPMADILCPQKECESEACERLGATLKAVRARAIEIMKKECGGECPCTAGACSTSPCPSCAAIKEKVIAPLFKERLAKPHAGCTLSSGPVCATCVDEMGAAVCAKIGALVGEKIAPTLAVVMSNLKDRAAKAGLAPCCDGQKTCGPCDEIKKAVLHPHVRERAQDKAGHEGTPCVFLKGEACAPCAQVLTDKVWARIKK